MCIRDSGSAYHGVVAHADEAHHLDVSRHGGRTCKLGVTVHAAHGVGQAIGSRTSCHVIRMQGTACAAAGSNREIFFVVFECPLLISACYQVLETGGVGGVTGNGNVDTLSLIHIL